jgi:hypothetical protein
MIVRLGIAMQVSPAQHLRTVVCRREHRVEAEFGGQALGLRTSVEARFGSRVDADGHGTIERGRFQAAAEAAACLEHGDVVIGGETVRGDET